MATLTPEPPQSTARAEYLATAEALDALAERCRFDAQLASDLKKLADRSRLKADCLIHPESQAWALLREGDKWAPGWAYGWLVDTRKPSRRFDSLSTLVDETLARMGVGPDDDFRAELAARLTKVAQENAEALRLTLP